MPTSPRRRRGGARTLAAVLALAGLGACGDDDDTTVAATSTTAADEASSTTTAAATTATTAADDDEEEAGAGDDTAAAAGGGIAVGDDPDVDAVVAAFGAVFDSTVAFDEKAPFLEDAEAVRATAEAYAAAATDLGGIALVPTAVVVDGDAATVTYDVLFGGQSAYDGQSGTAVRRGEGWIVSTDEFCSFMAAARTPCA